jgi:hypothetical protein
MATFKGSDAIQKRQAENVARQKNIVARRKGSRSRTYVVTTSDGRSFVRTTTPTAQGSVTTQGGLKRLETFTPRGGSETFATRKRQLTPSQKKQILKQETISRNLQASLEKAQIKEATRKAVESRFTAVRGGLSNNLEILRLQKQIKAIEKAPYRPAIREELTQILLSKTQKPRFGSVNIQGKEYKARTKAEKKFLENLKKYLSTEDAIAKKINNDFTKRNINVIEGDKWWVRALKGSGQAIGGLRYSPLQIGQLIAKGKIFRLSRKGSRSLGQEGFYKAEASQKSLVKQEKIRSLKAVPGEVGKSFDPTKPENWFNIATTVLLVAMSVKPTKLTTVKQSKSSIIRLKKAKVDVTKAHRISKNLISKNAKNRVLYEPRFKKLDLALKTINKKILAVQKVQKKLSAIPKALSKKRIVLTQQVKKLLGIKRKGRVFTTQEILTGVKKSKINVKKSFFNKIKKPVKGKVITVDDILSPKQKLSLKTKLVSKVKAKIIPKPKGKVFTAKDILSPTKKISLFKKRFDIIKKSFLPKKKGKIITVNDVLGGKIKKTSKLRLLINKKTSSLIKAQNNKLLKLKVQINDLKKSLWYKKIATKKQIVDIDDFIKNIDKKLNINNKFDKLIRELNRASKEQRKVLSGQSIKSPRASHLTVNGRKQWVFTDKFTGNVRYFPSYKQWFKAVKTQEKILRAGTFKKAVRVQKKLGVKKPKISVSEAKSLKAQRFQLRKEMNILNKQKKGLMVKPDRNNFVIRGGKKQYPFYNVKTNTVRYFDSFKQWSKAVRLSAKAQPKRLPTRVSREFRVLFKDNVPRPLQTKVRALVVREKFKPPVITVTQSPKKIVVLAKKPKTNVYSVKRIINKPTKTSSGAVEVKSSTGQVTVMAPLETVKKLRLKPSQLLQVKRSGLVKITSTKTVIVTKKSVISNLNKYYGLLLAQSNRGLNLQKALKNSVFNKLHQEFFPLLTRGVVKTSLVSKQSLVSKTIQKSSVKTRQKQAIKQKQIVKQRQLIKQRQAVRQKQAVRELSKLKSQLKDRVRRKLRQRKIRKKEIKLKLPKKDVEELFKWVKRQKVVYRPSLYAILLGIVGKQPKSVTGFEIRPVLKRKK